MSDAALQTAALLLLAHMAADFLLQTAWMVTHKRRPLVMALHLGVVFALSLAALGVTGNTLTAAVAITAAHAIIDAVKTWGLPEPARQSLTAFLADQAAHLASIALVAAVWPLTVASGLWADHLPTLTHWAIWISGAIAATLTGGHAVGMLMARYKNSLSQDSLPDAGRLIGQLERALIYLLFMTGQAAAIGFLIAAKSILRFDTAKDQKAGEYVIIGTLASFGWAVACALAAHALIAALPQGAAP